MFIGSAGNIIVGAGEGKFVTIKTFSKRNLDVTVYYNDGSTPIKGATVNVYSWDGYNKKWKDEYEETTNSQGKATFSSWPTSCSGEKYKLVVEHNGHSKTKEPVFVNKDSGSSYIITTDEPTVKKYYIRPACHDVDGNHLDDVSYESVDYPTYKGTCDYNEYIKAPGFGTYKVKFTKGDLEATITLESHLKTFAGTVVTLRKTKKSDIIVIVKDPDDNAVTPDTAILYIPSGDVWKEVKRLNPTSNAYTFTGLDAGTYHTEAYKDNVFIGSAENIEVSVGVCQIAYITTLYKRNLEVKVCYKDGSTPVVGATVKVYSWDGYNKKWDYEYKGTTNSQGKVTFSSWPTSCSGEKYKLVVEHNGYTKTKEPVYVNRDKGSSYTITMDDVGEEKPFISEVLLNRNPSIANLKCLHRAPNRAYSTALWYGDYRLEGLYAYVTIVNPTNKEFNGRLTWELMNCKREIVASGSGEGKLEIQPHTTKLTKLDIWRYCEWPVGFPSSGTYQLNITLREGELFGSNIDNKSIDMQLIDFSNEETPISYPMKDIDNDGKLEPVPGNEFYFFRKQDVDISGVDIIMMIIDFGIGLIIGEPPPHYTEIKRAELIKPGINTAKIALLDTGLKENTREITVKWWNVINELSGAGGTASWCANYDRAVITLELPLSVEIVDDGGACYHNKDMDNQKQYLVYYEVGVDKCIKPVPYPHPDNPAKQYIIRIRSKSESLKNIQIRGTIGLEFGPFRDNLLKSQKNIYDYAKWQDHPEDVYWGIYGIDKAEINVNIPPPPSNKPDLVVTKFDIQPNPCHIGDDVTVTFKVKNQGTADAGPHTEAFLTYSEHLSTHFFTCNGLKPGETKTFSFTKYNIQGPTGSFKFKVKADVYDEIPEWDEGNNIEAVNREIKPEEKDTTPPETKCTLSPSSPDGEYGWYVTPVTVTLESTDDSSGIDWIKYYRIDSGSWQIYYGNKVSFTVSEDGGHRIIYYARDKAGNKEDLKFSPFFFIDTTNPSASISINNGAEYTNSRSVTLYLTYSDNMGVRDCRYKNEGESWTSWESCSSTKSWTLTAGEETKKVYYQVKDWAGNIKMVYDTIILKQEEPKLCTSPDPPSHDFGTVPKDQTRSWNFDITNCGSGTLTWSVSCDQSWITVNPTSDSTTTEADVVTVTIDSHGLSPGTYTGHVTITSNGGSKTGTITVIRENQPPTNPILTPDKSSPQLAGTTIKWTASATDPDGDQLYYLFWLRGPATGNSWRIIKSYSTDNTWTWHTNSSDVGSNNICVYIKDGHHASEDLQKIVYGYEITPEKQRPTAFIDPITPNPATQRKDTVHFKGHGTDTDGHIVAYYWTSSIDGFLSSSKEFTKPASELSVGTHTIYFKVKDDDGQWSDWDTATLTIKKSSASNYKLDEYGVIQQEYNDDSGINRAAPPATDAMVLAPYIDLIPYGSVSSKVKVEIGITDGQVTEYDPTGNAILSSGRSKLTWSNQDITTDYHAELFYEADFRHTREVEAKIIPDQLKAEVRNIASYPLYNIIVLYPDSGYWRYATIDYLGVGAKKTVTFSSKKSPDSLVNNLYNYLEGALNDVGLVATQHRNDWLSGWVNYWLGIGFGSTYQPRVIYRLHQNQYEQYFTCSASPEPSKGMVRVGFVELFNVPTSSEPTKCKVPITTHSSLQDRPSIVYANGDYYVAYQSWEKGRGIFIKKFDSQWNFKKEKEVVSGSAYYDSPSLVFANNKLYVAYVSNEQGANANDYDVIVKEYDLDLKYISGSKKYLTKLQSCQDLPSLLYKDGYFYLAYQSWEKGNGDIFIKKFDSSWNPIKKVQVTSKSSYQDRPSIIYANGCFYVAYFSKETGNYDIFVKRLDSNLNLDSWKKQITSESSSQSYPFITFVNNEYTIVYASNEGGTLGIFMKKYSSNWNFIGKTKVVDDSSAHERRPSHIWDGSNYWVAYVYNYGESNDWNIFAIIPGCEGGSVPAPTPSPSCCPSMSISTGQDTYMPGDNVYVSITLTGRSGCTFRLNSPSIVSLIAPTGEAVTQTDMAQGITSSIAPGGHHTIGRSMKLPLNAPLGRYDVKVSLSGGKCTETANGLFHVITV